MAVLTIEGTYQDGRIELAERPEGVAGTVRVLVTFLPPETPEARSAEAREALRQRAFEQMEKGLHLGGPPYPKREELYDRFERPDEGDR